MNTPTPTPRTDAAWAQTFDANGFLSGRGNAASQMRDECATLERELTAITAELTIALAKWNGALERAIKAEADLAAERARLDWLETPSGMDWQWEPERLTVSRASIDAAMKEDAK